MGAISKKRLQKGDRNPLFGEVHGTNGELYSPQAACDINSNCDKLSCGEEDAALKATLNRLAPSLMILDSEAAILALSPVLENFAHRCGQPGAMHWLAYFLDEAVRGKRTPKLVLLLRPEEVSNRSLSADDLRGAALFFEYHLFGFNTGLVATGDAVGFNSVVAPAGERGKVAAIAARALVQDGAATVLATYEGASETELPASLEHLSAVPWATRERMVPRMLRLAPTLDEILQQMGKATRANLRRYRRRLETQVPCEYVADASPLLRAADLTAINAGALNPVAPAEFRRRVDSASSLRGSFLSGLRDRKGNWISLMGGWRQGDTTVLYWQMNSAGLEKLSVGTVMRSFFLEDEAARGTKQVLMFGGTPHSMRHAFQPNVIADLIMKRPGARAALERGAAKTLFRVWGWMRPSFVAEALCSAGWQWRSGVVRPPPPAPLVWQTARTHRAA